MTKLKFPLESLDVEELQARWQCGLNVIKLLAAQRKLCFYVLPVALEIALETSAIPKEQYDDALENLVHKQVDHRDVYKVLTNMGGTIAARNLIVDGKAISLGMDDLIVQLSDVIAFENQCEMATNSTFELLSDDFTCILFMGREYNFGPQQAKVIENLWHAYQAGNPWVYGKHILVTIGSGSDRIQSIFKRHHNWRDLVLSDGNGKYRLNLDNCPRERLTT